MVKNEKSSFSSYEELDRVGGMTHCRKVFAPIPGDLSLISGMHIK